jgi:hypothetical protein
MNRKKAEKMLKRLTDTAEMLACAQASLVETNGLLVEVLVQSLATHAQQSDDTPQTMQ